LLRLVRFKYFQIEFILAYLDHGITIMTRIFLFTLAISLSTSLPAQDKALPGKSLFIIHCSRCHGVKGAGGEGPSLLRAHLPRAANDQMFAQLITNGIPGTSMPGTWTLSDKEIKQVIAFVRSLSEQEGEVLLKGDVTKGSLLFEKSGCTSCHVINGKGISIGPDLSGVGLRRGSSYLYERLTHPGNNKLTDQEGFIQFLVIEVMLNDGTSIRGTRTNEDTFSIQLKDAENRMYSFRKDEVKSINRFSSESLMPSFSSLSEDDRNDLVAYLMNLK
jgi:putative heme-binding domain-containing protein